MKKLYLMMIFIIIASGCAEVKYREVGRDRGSREWGPREVKETVAIMTESLYKYLKEEWKESALIKVQKIRNRTSEHIDPKIISDGIVTNLIKLRINFIDETYEEESIKEMEKGMTGIIDYEFAIPAGELQSPNLYLFGDITDNMRYSGNKQLQFIVITLKLTEVKTGRLLWQEQKEILKESKTEKITF